MKNPTIAPTCLAALLTAGGDQAPARQLGTVVSQALRDGMQYVQAILLFLIEWYMVHVASRSLLTHIVNISQFPVDGTVGLQI